MINFELSKVVGREREREREVFIRLVFVTVCKTRDSLRSCHGRAHRGVSVTPQGAP